MTPKSATWASLYKQLTSTEGRKRCVRKPSRKVMKDFETSTGFALPYSYKEFIRVFGPGNLAWSYAIVAPGYPEYGEYVDLGLFNAGVKGQFTKRFLQSMSDSDRIVRSIFFARASGGDLIAWDPDDLQIAEQQEYGIYLLGRGSSMQKIADSFASFIVDYCLSDDNIQIPKDVESELGSRRVFECVQSDEP